MSRRTTLAATLLPLALLLTGCAGTDAPDEAAGSGTPATSTAQETSENPVTTSPATTSPAADPAVTALEVRVAGGQVTGDTGRVPVPLGDQVAITITSDVADEAHLHGYDVTADLEPGVPTELTVDATIPGVFELELHEAGTVLLTLQVS